MLFREYSRPFDPTANSPLNLIIGEERLLSENSERVFIPSHGPYYTASLLVTNGSTPLVRGIDYECIIMHREASVVTAKEVGVGIKIIRAGLVEIKIDYQAVGGQYQDLTGVLQEMMDNLGNELINPVPWKNIIDKPTEFNPTAHNHPYWELNGWDQLINPLDRVLQGIYFRDTENYKAVYDYFDTRLIELNTSIKAKAEVLSESIKQTYLKIRDPLNFLHLQANSENPATIKDGAWAALVDEVLGITADNTKLGTRVNASMDIVYPQPDNILLDESNVVIMRDDDEWIYLDNEHPVYPGFVDDYPEEVDEQFDLLYIKGFRKLSHGEGYSSSIRLMTTSPIQEGVLARFEITTYKYSPGLKIPYNISGIGAENITIPTSGYITLDQYGKAYISFTIIPGSPRTGSTSLTVSIATAESTPVTVPYVLNTNNTYSATLTLRPTILGVPLSSYVVGDNAVIEVASLGLAGKTVRLTAAFDAGDHTIALNGGTAVTQPYVDLVMVEGSTFVTLTSTQKSLVDVTRLNLNITYNSTNLDSMAVATSIKPTTVTVSGATTLDIGKSSQYTYSITPTGINYGTNIVWASSNTAVASISPTGVVTTIAEGTTTVSLTVAGKYTGSVTLIVQAAVTSPSLTTLPVVKTEVIGTTSYNIVNGINLYDYFVSLYGRAPRIGEEVVFKIPANVAIIAPNLTTAAITVDSRWDTSIILKVENNGLILGRGGNGGFSEQTPSFAGVNGGDAIKNLGAIRLNVINYGIIAGGGGGGAGEYTKALIGSGLPMGGGGGAPYGYGGLSYAPTPNGQDGSLLTGGVGGYAAKTGVRAPAGGNIGFAGGSSSRYGGGSPGYVFTGNVVIKSLNAGYTRGR